jgi:hypothetical protein
MAKRRNGASAFVVFDRAVSATDLKIRIAERDRREAADSRTDAQKWLGDPPPARSALAQAPHRSASPDLRRTHKTD